MSEVLKPWEAERIIKDLLGGDRMAHSAKWWVQQADQLYEAFAALRARVERLEGVIEDVRFWCKEAQRTEDWQNSIGCCEAALGGADWKDAPVEEKP